MHSLFIIRLSYSTQKWFLKISTESRDEMLCLSDRHKMCSASFSATAYLLLISNRFISLRSPKVDGVSLDWNACCNKNKDYTKLAFNWINDNQYIAVSIGLVLWTRMQNTYCDILMPGSINVINIYR